MECGRRNWVFSDGDLPPSGSAEPFGHEALMVTNLNDRPAEITLDFYFEDREPVRGIRYTVEAERVACIRLDGPLGAEGYRLPFGQYALRVQSPLPVVAVFGRLDVRQPNLAYYPVQGFSW